MSRPARLASLVAALLLAPAVARAQFTPSLPVPRQRPAVVEDANAGRRTARDTTPRVRLSDLKAWVDSVTQYAPATLPAPGATAPAGPPPAPTPGPTPRRVAPVRPAPTAPPSTPPASTPPASTPPASTPATTPPASTPR